MWYNLAMTKPNIEFNIEAELDGIFERPVPAKAAIPEWWKKQERYQDNKVTYNKLMEVSHTIKRCMPVMDSMTAGYIVKLPCDLIVTADGDLRNFDWKFTQWDLIGAHGVQQVSQYPIDDTWYPMPFKFQNPFGVKTPDGYSCLFVDPLHGDDKPFMCLPAVVDTDDFNTPLNFPFLIKKDFSGVIPAGTPIIQIIPFKREEWTSSYGHITQEQRSRMRYAARFFADRYMKFFRKPKNFN